jgi:glycerophosphoryl diester phosphodiesterase
MAAYRLAIAQGADFIEPDLVMTNDGVLVCRHENEISGTTDVAEHPEFASRQVTKVVDGVSMTGWWAEDFSLAELRTLRCRERLPRLRPGNAAYDRQEVIPTFAEALALAREAGIGIYPELKHPTFLREHGLDPIPVFVDAVRAGGGQAAADKMFVQCFEVGALHGLASMSSMRWNCVQLIAASGGPWDQPGTSYAQMVADSGLRAMLMERGIAAIGIEKSLIVPRDNAGRSSPATDLIARAHGFGLAVHAWTFRAENIFLPLEMRSGDDEAAHGDLTAELRAFYAAGVDGVFSDFPAAAVAARA